MVNVDGSVKQADVKETSLNAPGVGSCITDAVKASTFPKPEGAGIVEVNYPFTFEPG